jgi:hypothetical protein
MKDLVPVIDTEVLQEKVNQAAMKGALSTIEDFYTGYNSPFKKAIKEDLESKEIRHSFELPDIIATINDSLTTEIDRIANTAVSKSFVPLVQRFLTRTEDEIKFSDILKEFIESNSNSDRDYFDVSVKRHEKYSWLDVNISCEDKTYKLTLHTDYKSEKEGNVKYIFLSLPYTDNGRNQTMKLSIENGVTLELPFTKDILKDNFTSYIARLVMSGSLIIMDVEYFEDWMFPENGCRCDD